jgi:hypothetical protein
MSLHTAVLFLHVVAAVTLVGHSLGTPLVLAAIRAAPTVAALRPWLRFAHDSARVNPLAALVLLATGIQLGSGRWDEGWLQVACALFVWSTALAVGVVKATGERVAALAAADAEADISPALDTLRRSARWMLAADALVATDLATLFLMVAQPGLLVSVAVVVAANAGALGLRAVRNRRAAAPSPGLPSAA